MDSSRGSLQAPAETSIPGRFPEIKQSPEQAERDLYLVQLLFAARNLAMSQFTRGGRIRPDGGVDPLCVECRTPQCDSRHLDHALTCNTGRVLKVIDALGEASPKFQERRSSEEIRSEQGNAAATTAPRLPALFREPWATDEVMPATIWTGGPDGDCVLDVEESGMLGEGEAKSYARRIVACVNACVGVPTEALEAGAQ